MIARGTSRRASRHSSARVETASKPRNDRHSTAAPAIRAPKPGCEPSPSSGDSRSSGWPASDWQDRATNTTMNTICAPTIRLLVLATEWMPTTLSTVTRAIDASAIDQAGMAGKAMLRNRPISR
ncbi:hypothetical protein D3C81_1813080 [compost metagenome]